MVVDDFDCEARDTSSNLLGEGSCTRADMAYNRIKVTGFTDVKIGFH